MTGRGSERIMQNRSRILDAIVKPHDIQTLSTQELEQLSEDCRQRIIEVTSQKGDTWLPLLGLWRSP